MPMQEGSMLPDRPMTRLRSKSRWWISASAFALGAAWLVYSSSAAESTNRSLIVTPCDHPDGVYRLNETITWKVDVAGTNEVKYAIRKGGLTVLSGGKLPPTNGAHVSASLDQPGTILFEIKTKDGRGNSTKITGWRHCRSAANQGFKASA
jgi:hypothetical protein